MDDPDQLKRDLEVQTRLAEDRLEQLRYLQADFENMRKRYEKEKMTLVATANESLMRDLLVILDELERAIPAIRHEPDRQGVEMVHKKLLRILGQHGLLPMECTGKRFDPAFHEAVCRERCNQEPGTIVEDLARGYRLGSKVIRPAKVKVAEQDPGTEGEEHG